MATPLQIGGAGMAIGGGVLSGIGSYMQGQSTGAQLDFNSRQTRIDAQITQQNATEQAKRLRTQGRYLTGQQRTKFAVSGVRIEGTPLEVMAESIKNVELDAIKTKEQGIWQAQNLNLQADFMAKQAKQVRKAGTIGAIAGVLGAGAGAAGMFV